MTEKKKRGFALLDKKELREIASKGGVAAHKLGKAYEWTPEQAREAGRKGGTAAHNKVSSEKAASD